MGRRRARRRGAERGDASRKSLRCHNRLTRRIEVGTNCVLCPRIRSYAWDMRAGAAVSRAEDVRLAARDAATRALDAAGLDEAACLIVAATPEHLDEAVELCEALRDAAGAARGRAVAPGHRKAPPRHPLGGEGAARAGLAPRDGSALVPRRAAGPRWRGAAVRRARSVAAPGRGVLRRGLRLRSPARDRRG